MILNDLQGFRFRRRGLGLPRLLVASTLLMWLLPPQQQEAPLGVLRDLGSRGFAGRVVWGFMGVGGLGSGGVGVQGLRVYIGLQGIHFKDDVCILHF